MTNEEIKEIVEYFRKQGKQIRVRDIAYAMLSRLFESDVTAYQCLFGNEGYEEYKDAPERKEIENYLKLQGHIKTQKASDDELSFEQNKREMQALIQRFEDGIENGTIEPAIGLAKIADIRVKLNDKFNIQEEQQERVIQVIRKFNAVCDCGREIYVPTKQELMEEYNLIEKPNTDGRTE